MAIPILYRMYDANQLCIDCGWEVETRANMTQAGVLIAGEPIYSALLFFLTRHVLKNKLNLK